LDDDSRINSITVFYGQTSRLTVPRAESGGNGYRYLLLSGHVSANGLPKTVH